MTKTMECPRCQTKVEAGNQTRGRGKQWTEYTCPECGLFWLMGVTIRGPKPSVAVETEATEPAEERPEKGAPTAAAKEEVEEESDG